MVDRRDVVMDADFQTLERWAIRTGCETELNRQADVELKRRGYVFNADGARWESAHADAEARPTEEHWPHGRGCSICISENAIREAAIKLAAAEAEVAALKAQIRDLLMKWELRDVSSPPGADLYATGVNQCAKELRELSALTAAEPNSQK